MGCAQLYLTTQNANEHIIGKLGSQPGIKAINSHELVLVCLPNKVQLSKVPGLRRFKGNEKADELAKIGT